VIPSFSTLLRRAQMSSLPQRLVRRGSIRSSLDGEHATIVTLSFVDPGNLVPLIPIAVKVENLDHKTLLYLLSRELEKFSALN
jgi:hypothetical protein